MTILTTHAASMIMPGSSGERPDTTLSGTNHTSRQQYNQLFPSVAAGTRYASDMAIWVHSILRADSAGLYYPFVLTHTARLPWCIWLKRLFHACVETSRQLFPELSRSNSSRHHSDKSAGMALLPAESASGLTHAHGFVRIPSLAVRADLPHASITIQESCAKKVIEGPPALNTFAANLRSQFHPGRSGSTSLWIANHGEPVDGQAEAADHLRYPEITARAFAYLQNTGDGEVREWATTDLLPHAVFRRICPAVAKGE